jgi:RNA polymerase sigma-70 factor (ECF subfamily)
LQRTNSSEDSTRRNFPATAWTVIRGAQGAEQAARKEALERLISIYWRPVYWQLRRDWSAPHWEAADLTQEYFSKLLEGTVLEGVSPDRGSFRAYVKATLRNFVLNSRRAANTQARGGGRAVIPLGELKAIESEPPSGAESPDRVFEKELMRAIVRDALENLRESCERRGRLPQFDLFYSFYSGEQAGERVSYTKLQEQFSLGPHEVKNQLADMRVRFRKQVLDRLRDGISTERELVQEIREVFGE